MPLTLVRVDVGLAPGDRLGTPGRGSFQIVNLNADYIEDAMLDAELKAFVAGGTSKGESIIVNDTLEHWHMPYAFVVTEIQAGVHVAPTGADIQIDVLENGYSVLDSAGLAIAAGEKFGVWTAYDYIILEKGSELTFDVLQVGSTEPGEWLKVTVVGYVIMTSA